MMNKLYIVGIGFKPLEERVKHILLQCPFIVVSPRLNEVFKKYDIYDAVRSRIANIKTIKDTFNFIKKGIENHNIALIASGDPLYFGIGIKAIETFGDENIEIYPDLSCLQKALSIIKKNWYGISTLSFHGRQLDIELIIDTLLKHDRVAILTDTINSPDTLAREIMNKKEAYTDLNFYVFERLGYEDEKITVASLKQVTAETFNEPNFVILSCENKNSVQNIHSKYLFGVEEKEIIHENGMITKDEIRASIIHRLKPPKKGVIWDIGAGSGAVSIELAMLSDSLKIYAIEKESTDLIKRNKENLELGNLKIIEGQAPSSLYGLPEPDRVFIGGSGGKLNEILDFISQLHRLKIVVIAGISMETLNNAINLLESKEFMVDISQINVARIETKYGRKLFKALNPVFIIRGQR
ncbi:precorrin-6y C5,15-methyltransferase (decarboxylating) subunit CbiE [Thermodesulfovibrio thiophilus]|uniref:precorrin-6y C5,15-methyltransferase (decarboxylating) subunit CbiE n=1 Tax=Thermodesulfovibrio thiophilus TaxID=340095 RepID=UPI001790DED3|nr:precorrin-6y C5,15-methyltransferase (decarboxylating) subunit CbiE [Thermodesulfovibrio thiophilus]HHW19649.1 precorrin-6y C5,15-methyltransferase (decarboxylating) subunit CbiE [Thermodesulfovibrio thiophilus]